MTPGWPRSALAKKKASRPAEPDAARTVRIPSATFSTLAPFLSSSRAEARTSATRREVSAPFGAEGGGWLMAARSTASGMASTGQRRSSAACIACFGSLALCSSSLK